MDDRVLIAIAFVGATLMAMGMLYYDDVDS
jgi:hypothetical protein